MGTKNINKLTTELNKVQTQLNAFKRDAERKQPLFKTKGITVFYVLSKKDLEAIWNVTGVQKPLVRCTNMPTAKFSVQLKGGIVIYLDVRPSGIFYSTNQV